MIGERIKEARENAGYTQDNFCVLIKKSKRTLLNYEKNESEPSVNVALDIAKICNVDKIWLITGEQKSEVNIDEVRKNISKNLTKLNSTQLQYINSLIEFEISKVN